MKINKTGFLHALEIVKPGLASKENNIDQSTAFAFIQDRIVTYNDEISVSHPLPGMELTGVVSSTELYSLLSKLTKEDVDLIVEDSELRIKCGRAKAGLTFQAEVRLPIDDVGRKGKWKPIPEDLVKAMSFSMGSCSKDSTQPILTCVHVNKAGFVESTDNFRITRVTLTEPLPVNTFLIPAHSALMVARMNPTKIAEGDGWVHFKTGEGTVISCRTFADDEFPDTNAILKVKGKKIEFPENINEILDKAIVFCKGIGESLDIEIENNILKIKSHSDGGWFEEKTKINYAEDSINFAITPDFLKDIITKTPNCVIAEDRLKFTGKNWVYVTILKTK
jgi:DNA polymerase III sliding clamp (beta) subunit (PCNA family)